MDMVCLSECLKKTQRALIVGLSWLLVDTLRSQKGMMSENSKGDMSML